MAGYLLDTNALSILAPPTAARGSHGNAFRSWVRQNGGDLFLSTITLAEIQAGIAKLERKRAWQRARDLARWLNAVVELYQARTLPLVVEVALETGRMLDRAVAAGADPGFEDAAIAATAAVHALTVITANQRHFQLFGVSVLSPLMD